MLLVEGDVRERRERQVKRKRERSRSRETESLGERDRDSFSGELWRVEAVSSDDGVPVRADGWVIAGWK